MLRLFIFAVALFVVLPYDAQIAILSGLRLLWLTDGGRSVLLGALGATVTGALWYAAGWNALAAQLYREEAQRADDNYNRRRR
jgi:hypothetical protein